MNIMVRETASGNFDLLLPGVDGEPVQIVPALTRGQLGSMIHYLNGGENQEARISAQLSLGK